MNNQIKIDDIYDKNINFILGSGASYGLFPTLALTMRDSNGNNHTIETLAEEFDAKNAQCLKTLLFMYYFQECIKPVMALDISSLSDQKHISVIQQYDIFLNTILSILYKRRSPDRRCNIFTTNYDGCLVFTADNLLSRGRLEFTINDGTRGFKKRYLQAKNFNAFTYQSGIFGQHYTDVPQISLINLHGSVYWKKENDNIIVDYKTLNNFEVIDRSIEAIKTVLGNFTHLVSSEKTTLEQLRDIETSLFSEELMNEFWLAYKGIPIVNPEKWKFHETVFEEHYYQMLRALSYELEKPNTVFVSFGFSFADKHILNLVKRSLSNPTLQLFVCCFDEKEKKAMQEKFIGHSNVQLISISNELDFNRFNQCVLNLKPQNDNEDVTS